MASALRLGAGSLRELRIHLCQKSAASQGVRDFIEQHYVALKKNNKDFPILIRECSGIAPRVWGRFTHGQETSVSLENAGSDRVMSVLKDLASK
uniref:NADH dehydrogenase [ubiquinone] 1 alpha subcomplex subunit 2 n=1 Tax=Plectus sambesii TaxID=2011161 RepID=A0A914WLU4_9BILA